MFELKDQHLKLLRRAIVVWSPVESGAPAVLLSPLMLDDEAGPELYLDLAARAGISVANPPTAAEQAQLDLLLKEMPQALAVLLDHGRLEAGAHTYTNPLAALPFGDRLAPPGKSELAKTPEVTFALTAQHLALLREARWEELFVNPKRPYGNMTYFELEMAEILHLPPPTAADGFFPKEQQQLLQNLHEETLPALQLFLQKATLAPGAYSTE